MLPPNFCLLVFIKHFVYKEQTCEISLNALQNRKALGTLWWMTLKVQERRHMDASRTTVFSQHRTLLGYIQLREDG